MAEQQRVFTHRSYSILTPFSLETIKYTAKTKILYKNTKNKQLFPFELQVAFISVVVFHFQKQVHIQKGLLQCLQVLHILQSPSEQADHPLTGKRG